MNIPEQLLYTKEHEWVKVEGDKVWIGITDFAQHKLGDIVFVELPELETEVEAGDAMVVIESVKAVSSVYSWVAGTVVEVNEALEDTPELLNEAPYENWIAVVLMNNSEEVKGLLNAQEYELLCQEQEQEDHQ